MTYHCGICHEAGHNRRTCPSITNPTISISEQPLSFIQNQVPAPQVSRVLFPEPPQTAVDVNFSQMVLLPQVPEHSASVRHTASVDLRLIFDGDVPFRSPITDEEDDVLIAAINQQSIPAPIPASGMCVICMEPLADQAQTELLCHHAFCTQCIMTNLEHGNLNCPMCRTEVKKPSKKVAALERENMEQHRELCEMDDTMELHRAKFKSYEENIKRIQQQKKRYKDVGSSLKHLLSLSSWPYDSDSDTTIMCLEEFRDSLSLEYKRYIEHFYKSQRSPTTAPPTLEHMIFSLFTRKGNFDHLSSDEKHESQVLRDCRGVLLSPDCWIKIGEGKYRNHMARLIWNYAKHTLSGYYAVRIYRGLGKPKLSQGVYDCSYTTDIKLQVDTTDVSNLEGGTEECVITPDMLTRVPDDAVSFTVKGNSVSLPKDVRKQLRANKMNVVLHRVAVL
jgi:hypothetical protein